MSTLPIDNAKKYTDFDAIAKLEDSAIILAHTGDGIHKITYGELKAGMKDLFTEEFTGFQNDVSAIDNVLAKINAPGAAAHNSIGSNRCLGNAVTQAQWEALAADTFEDMYVGDYWTIGGINYRIAAFDYYLRSGDTECTKPHITLVPDTSLYTHVMNDSNITTGAYVGSKMYTEGLAQAKATINAAFGSAHILNHRQYLKNAVTNGYESGGSWYDSTVELMTEQNVYGGTIFAHTSSGTAIPAAYTIDKSQFPLFAFRPDLISNRQTYWLRDVVSAASFASVTGHGIANSGSASDARGFRPAFSIIA